MSTWPKDKLIEMAVNSIAKDMAKEMAEAMDKRIQGLLVNGCLSFYPEGLLNRPTVAPLPTIKCQYCENTYQGDIINQYDTCPTCGGDWPKEKK